MTTMLPDLPEDIARRGACFELATKTAPADASVYDLVTLADWLDRGHEATRDEPEPCSCNNPDAEHPRGDSAFCSMAP